jgi:hypothetical protein
MLAHGEERDVPDHDQLFVVGLEGCGQHILGLDPQAREQLGVRASDPGWGALETIAVRVLADGDENLPDRALDALEVYGICDWPAGEFTVDQPRSQVVQSSAVFGEVLVVQIRCQREPSS